jgi:hypothetical protein
VERGDRILIGFLISPSAAGQFGVASDLVRRIMQGLTINPKLVFARTIMRQFDAGQAADVASMLNDLKFMTLFLGIPVAGTALAFGPELAQQIFGERLGADAYLVIQIVGFAFILEALRSCVFDVAVNVAKEPRLFLVASGTASFVQIIAVTALGWAFATKGVAFALLITHLIYMVVSGHLARKALPGLTPSWQGALGWSIAAVAWFVIARICFVNLTDRDGLVALLGAVLAAIPPALILGSRVSGQDDAAYPVFC